MSQVDSLELYMTNSLDCEISTICDSLKTMSIIGSNTILVKNLRAEKVKQSSGQTGTLLQ